MRHGIRLAVNIISPQTMPPRSHRGITYSVWQGSPRTVGDVSQTAPPEPEDEEANKIKMNTADSLHLHLSVGLPTTGISSLVFHA